MASREHQSLGDLDAPWEGPSKADKRRQADAERARAVVWHHHLHSDGHYHSHTHDGDLGHVHEEKDVLGRADGEVMGTTGPAVEHLPPLTEERRAALLALMRPPAPSELTTWRLRLFCGHVVERTSHHTRRTVSEAFMSRSKCETCGLDPVVIVAGKPLLPAPGPTTPAPPKRQTARMKADLAAAEAEVARLKKALGD